MKLRYIIIPLCIILYIWWSYAVIVNYSIIFREFSFISSISAIWLIITGATLFSGGMFLIVLLIDYCEKHW